MKERSLNHHVFRQNIPARTNPLLMSPPQKIPGCMSYMFQGEAGAGIFNGNKGE